MIRSKRILSAVALVAGLALVAAACGGGDDDSGGSTSTTAGGSGAKPAAGTLTVGAEQDATCADWVSNCAASGGASG